MKSIRRSPLYGKFKSFQLHLMIIFLFGIAGPPGVQVKTGGKLQRYSNLAGDTMFYGAFCEKTRVALRQFPISESDQYETELEVLLTPINLHENFIRYFAYEVTDDKFFM